MGDCHIFHDEIRISTRSPDVTEVWVYLRGEGDCPFQCVGWRYKAFPLSASVADILTMWSKDELGPISWPRMDPPPTVPNYNPDWDAIEAGILELMEKRGPKADE